MKRVFVLCLMTLCVHLVRGQFSGQGSGTAEDPFLVSTALNVWEIRNFQGKSTVKFKLINDVDLSKLIEDTDGDAGWSPIPNFCGELDGNGYAISGLFINRPYTDNIGFFGVLGYGAYVHHLTLVYSGDIVGQNYVGGLCGNCDQTYQSDPKSSRRIECCKIKAKLIRGTDNKSGASAVGGLCGFLSGYLNYDTNKKVFRESYVRQCVVDASQIYGSGLIGRGELNRIDNNRVRANIISGSYVGGIVGSDAGSEIYNNLFEGTKITSGNNGGGIFYSARMYNYDYKGYVRSNAVICDSIITAYFNGKIGRIGAYTDGSVSVSSPTDQKANKAYSKIVLKKDGDCYLATDDVLNGYGVGNILLKSASMYEGMGWDMENVWTIDEGSSYPRLIWEVETGLNDKVDDLIKEEGLPIQIRKNNGTITIVGIAKNTLVSAYSLSGTLLDSATSQAEMITFNLPTSVDVMILKIGDKSIKITF